MTTNFKSILTQPIIQEIVPHFHPKEWRTWNLICRDAHRLSKTFFAHMTQLWSKKCPDKLPKTDFSIEIFGYTTSKCDVGSLSYVVSPSKKRLHIGEGRLRCGCSQHGKVGIQNSQLHGSVLDCHIHTHTDIDFHGHYINGVPVVTWKYLGKNGGTRHLARTTWIMSKENGEPKVDSELTVRIEHRPQIHESMWEHFNYTLTDPASCNICAYLEKSFPEDTRIFSK